MKKGSARANEKSNHKIVYKDSDVTQKGTEWKCNLCGKIFSRVDNAIVHVNQMHWKKAKSSIVPFWMRWVIKWAKKYNDSGGG